MKAFQGINYTNETKFQECQDSDDLILRLILQGYIRILTIPKFQGYKNLYNQTYKIIR